MSLIIREVNVKSILTRTGIPGIDYCINPYVGGFTQKVIDKLKKGLL